MKRITIITGLLICAALLTGARLPLESNQRSPLIPNPGSFHFSYPDYIRHCTQRTLEIPLQNPWPDTVWYAVNKIEDPGTYSGWLDAINYSGMIPPDESDTGQIILNLGAQICAPGIIVKETGRVNFVDLIHADTAVFEIELIVADTVILPVWDTVSTSCLSLAVGNNGNMGNMGVGGANMDYSNNPMEWKPDDYDIYLYDGGQVIGWIEDGDTIVNWGMFQATIADSVALIPQGGEGHSTTAWADISTSGIYTTNDTGIAMTSIWYAPTPVDSCDFVIKKTKLWSLSGAKTGLMIGEVIDWDVPGDSIATNNSSGSTIVEGYPVIYQQGIEIPGYDDSLECANGGWDNDQRFGGIMYLGTYLDGGSGPSLQSYTPYGMYTADNEEFVFPYPLGFDAGLLYQNHSLPGPVLTDSTGDLHSGMTYVFDYDLGANDTLVLFTAYATVLNDTYPAKTPSAKFIEVLTKALDFFHNHIGWHSPGCLAGDANHDGSVDITDLTFFVDFMFGGGAAPPCQDEADFNGDNSLDIVDLTARVDWMFNGGPAPVCGSTGT